MKGTFLNGRITVKVGDLTAETVDAVVNAANKMLLGGGGVDGAIHRNGGPQIIEECRVIRAERYPGGLPAGEAAITTGGSLPARFVIHTVGPVYGMNNGRDAELLANCYVNSIDVAVAAGLRSIAFPSISTGAFGYPKHEAAKVASRAVTESLEKNTGILDLRLVFFSDSDATMFLKHCDF